MGKTGGFPIPDSRSLYIGNGNRESGSTVREPGRISRTDSRRECPGGISGIRSRQASFHSSRSHSLGNGNGRNQEIARAGLLPFLPAIPGGKESGTASPRRHAPLRVGSPRERESRNWPPGRPGRRPQDQQPRGNATDATPPHGWHPPRSVASCLLPGMSAAQEAPGREGRADAADAR